MRTHRRPATGLTIVAMTAALLIPVAALAVQRTGGHTNSGGGAPAGTAVPRGGGSSGGTSSGSPSGGGGSPAVARPAPTGNTTSGSSDKSSDGSGGDTSHSRPRNGQPVVGHAEPRPEGGHGSWKPGGGGYYGGYLPWGYGGFGFAGYYGGWYDPWFYGDGSTYPSVPYDQGALRLKVKPRDAQVFVDGYFAGQVDEFDGVFQRLKLESGPHRIEITADGYEPLSFEIRVLPDQTITYQGDLKRLTQGEDGLR